MTSVRIADPITYTIYPADRFLWVVKCYCELLTRNERLTYGSGLNRLYVLVAGGTTFNDLDIANMAKDAEEFSLTKKGLDGFLLFCISANIKAYAEELIRRINDRIVDIANGRVTNPDTTVSLNPDRARRNYYLPPMTLVRDLEKNIWIEDRNRFEDPKKPGFAFQNTLHASMTDFDMCLYRLKGAQGTVFAGESSFGALNEVLQSLLRLIRDVNFGYNVDSYNENDIKTARTALRIIWAIGKMIFGDLTEMPDHKDTNLCDLDLRISISDGTLAAIPFPTSETIGLFSDEYGMGVSGAGRKYLTAVSTCQFYDRKFHR